MSDEARAVLLANGFHRARGEDGAPKDASIEEGFAKALMAYRAAEQKLGAKPDELTRLPGDRQSPGQWLKSLGARAGVPETPEGYDIGKATLPDGVPYDETFEKEALAALHAAGAPKDVAKAARDVFAAKVASLYEAAATERAEAMTTMNAALTAEWGAQTPVKREQAARAFQHFAEAAGLDADSRQSVAAKLTEALGGAKDGGDARVVRMFAAIAEKMSEDRLVAGQPFGDAGAMTPASARARLAQIKAPDGDFARARSSNDVNRMRDIQAEIGRLSRIIAPPEPGR